VSVLGKFGADVIVLTEYKENSNAPILKTRLFEIGYKWQASSSIASNENSVFLASKVPFISNCQFGILGSHAHRLLFARFLHFNLIGVLPIDASAAEVGQLHGFAYWSLTAWAVRLQEP
jgi:hypothetical protein